MFRWFLTAGVVLGLCLGLFQGFNAQAAQGTPCPAPTDEEIEALVDDFREAYSTHDVDALVAMMATDVVREWPGGDITGTADVAAGFERLFTAYPDLTATVNLVLIDAPLGVVHLTTSGTQAVPIGGVEPTGETTTWSGISMVRFECGKIDMHLSELDQLSQQGRGTSTPVTPVADVDGGTPASCPELTDELATSLMDAWYHEIWIGNLDLLETITTQDVYHHWAMGPDSSGQEMQRTHLQGTLEMLEGITSDYDQMVVDEDHIAVRWTQSLGDDTWGGLNIFRIECGMIDEVWSEMNLNELPAQDAEATPAA